MTDLKKGFRHQEALIQGAEFIVLVSFQLGHDLDFDKDFLFQIYQYLPARREIAAEDWD